MHLARAPSFEPENTVLSLLTLQWPSPLMLLIGATLVFAWRFGRPTAQALTAAAMATVLLHGLAWLSYGSGNGLHALCSATGLGLVLPITLRSRRIYPLVAGAAGLLAVLVLGCATLLEGQAMQAARLIASMANAVLVLALWTGIVSDWRYRKAPFSGGFALNPPLHR